MAKNDGKFIVTFNADTAEKMLEMGLRLIETAYDRYVFMNEPDIPYEELKDFYFTNVLFI